MAAFLPSLLLVTLAEMGDKTQLLAMAFATRYSARTVLSAIVLATVLNHALAVAAGRLLVNVIPIGVISLVASLSFVLFGLWTIRGDTLEGEDQRPSPYGPLVTVAVAFFLAELGDKTQLATISLAVRYDNPMAVLLGSTTGMVIADGFGIIIAGVLGKRIPDTVVRLVSAAVFIVFGFHGASTVLAGWFSLASRAVVLFVAALATLGAAHYYFILGRRRSAAPTVHPLPDLAERVPQTLTALLLLTAWVISLGLPKPLAAFDHWITFVLLVGIAWKMIHGVVQSGRPPVQIDRRLSAVVLILASLTSARAFLERFDLALAIVPVALLIAAALLIVCAPLLARSQRSEPLRKIGQHPLEIAGGLVLIGIALKTLIDH